MKVTPVAGAPGIDIGAASTARSNPDTITRAKAIAAGEDPGLRLRPSETPVDPQVARIQKRRIKMTTQASPDRQLGPDVLESLETDETQSAIPDVSEQTLEAEATKPLSPQFAALAKQRRALQQERANFEREKAEILAAKGASAAGIDRARLMEDPLGVLDEAGVLNDSFYNSLTDRLLNGQANPAASQIQALKAEIEALKTGIDTKLTERDSQAEKQVVAEIDREAKMLVEQTNDYSYTRAMGKANDVSRLIHENWKKTGEVMETDYALGLIEAECKKDYEALQARLGLTSPQPKDQPARQQQSQGMRTLTNRDTARPTLSRRDRMIAAFKGEKQ